MGLRGPSRKTITAFATVLTSVPLFAVAQDGQPGLDLTFDVGVTASVSDNAGLEDPAEDPTFRTGVRLGFGLASETRVQELRIGANTRLDYVDGPGESGDIEIASPAFTLSYSRFVPNSRLDFATSYRRDSVDDRTLTVDVPGFNPIDLIVSGGTLEDTRASVGFATGIEAPFGYNLGVSITDRDYTDTTDPDLYDRRTITGTAGTRFRFSPVAEGRITASYSLYEAENAVETERRTTRIGVGGTLQASPILSIDGSISYNLIEIEEIGAPDDETEGVGATVSVARDMPNGSIVGSVSHRIESAAERTEFSIRRAMDLPRGALTYGIGYTTADEGDGSILLNVSAVRDLRDGSLRASLSQRTVSDDEDNDLRLTTVDIDYRYEINSVSSLGVGLGLGRTDALGASGEDKTRADLSVTYRRQVTRDWDWSLGYRARYIDEPARTATSNTVFTGFDRSFSIRP